MMALLNVPRGATTITLPLQNQALVVARRRSPLFWHSSILSERRLLILAAHKRYSEILKATTKIPGAFEGGNRYLKLSKGTFTLPSPESWPNLMRVRIGHERAERRLHLGDACAKVFRLPYIEAVR